MPACWLKPTAQLPAHPRACRNLSANNRDQLHCDPGGQKCTGCPGPLRRSFQQLVQTGSLVKSRTCNDCTGFYSVPSPCLNQFYPILVRADVTNTAPWLDHLAVSYRQSAISIGHLLGEQITRSAALRSNQGIFSENTSLFH